MFVGNIEEGVKVMAIAPLPQQEELELFEMPWPKPAARSLSVAPEGEWESADQGPVATITELFPYQGRRVVHRSTAVRRRRLLLGGIVVAVLLALALPLRSLGAVTTSGVATPGGSPAGLGDGTPYVVQPGDTLASIARSINPSADQAKLIGELRTVVGSSVVVPGEHVILP